MARFALDMDPPAVRLQPRLALAIDIPLVAILIPTGVAPVEHVFEMAGSVLSGGTDPDLAEQLVLLIGAGRELVAEVRLPVLLGPAGLGILLSPLRRRPVTRRGLLLDQFLFLLAEPLPWHRNEAGIDDLPTSRDVAVLGQFTLDSVEQRFRCARCDQPLAERPQRRAIRNLTAVASANKTLEAQPIQELELHLFVPEVVQLLQQQCAHHQFGRKRRTPAARPARTQSSQLKPEGSLGC